MRGTKVGINLVHGRMHPASMVAVEREEAQPAEVLEVDEQLAQVGGHPPRVVQDVQEGPDARVRACDRLMGGRRRRRRVKVVRCVSSFLLPAASRCELRWVLRAPR